MEKKESAGKQIEEKQINFKIEDKEQNQENKQSSSSIQKQSSEKKEASYYRCSFGCIWKWILLTVAYILFYGFFFLFTWLLIYACTVNTLGSLITFSVMMAITITLLAGSVWYGATSSLHSQALIAFQNSQVGEKKF